MKYVIVPFLLITSQLNAVLTDPLLAQVNDELLSADTEIVSRQTTYFSGRGRYFQGLWTSGSIPEDGAQITPSRTSNPHDQAQTWEDAGIVLPSQMRLRIRIDTYKLGRNNFGFIVIGEVRQGGTLYRRKINHGNKTRAGHDWIEVVEE